MDLIYLKFCQYSSEILDVRKDLSYFLETYLSLPVQINELCQTSSFHTRNIRQTRTFIGDDTHIYTYIHTHTEAKQTNFNQRFCFQ